LRWLWTHWYIPVLAVAGILGFLAGARLRSPLALAKDELEAVDAGERARLAEIELGRDAANAEIDAQHKEMINELGAGQKRKADDLLRDPARRARFLARVSRKRPGDAI
jgi:hypothetical protein